MEAFETIESYSEQVAARLHRELEKAGLRLIAEKAPIPYHLFFDLLPKEHLTFFRNLQLYHRSHGVLCVHGGLDPRGGPVEQQDRESLLWGTDNFPRDYQGPEMIVYGHWNDFTRDRNGCPQPHRTGPKTICIDTISSGILTAIRFPGYRVFQSGLHTG